MKISDIFGSKAAKKFRLSTKGIDQREALAAKMVAAAGIRRGSVAAIVYERLIYQIGSTSCPFGPWTSSILLASRTGFSADAVTRALRTLQGAGLISWKLHKQHGAPTRHFTLLKKARQLLKNVLSAIRQIKRTDPPKPITTPPKPQNLQNANVETPPIPERKRPAGGSGLAALAAIRQTLSGGRQHG